MFPSKEFFRSAVFAVVGGIITVVILKVLEIRDEDELNDAEKQPQENEERLGNGAANQPQENDERLGNGAANQPQENDERLGNGAANQPQENDERLG